MRVITIGRSVENDVVIHDPYATRHHLQIIQHDDGHFSLADFGSTNGTFINGQMIRGEVDLNMNDVVRIGNTTIPWRLYFEEEEVIQSNNAALPYDDMEAISSNQTIPKSKERHGFVTFWLWLMIVGSVIGGVSSIISSQDIFGNINYIYNEYSQPQVLEYLNLDQSTLDGFRQSAYTHTIIFVVCSLLSGICSFISLLLIMGWKKVGFWCWVCANIVFGVISVFLMILLAKVFASINLQLQSETNPIIVVTLITIPVGILILWSILQIKKNGFSCWKLLE